MLFKVAICDDEEKDIQAIQRFLHIYEMQHDIDFEINTFQNSTKLLEKYDSAGRYNILFLDVEMPKLSGLEVAAHIREIPDRMAKLFLLVTFRSICKTVLMWRLFTIFQNHFFLKILKNYYSALLNLIVKVKMLRFF